MPNAIRPLGHVQQLRATLSVQFLRYATVGLVVNLTGYLLYLSLTWCGIGHKTAMTLLFFCATFITFFVNRSWSFQSTARSGTALTKYVSLYGCGYVLNWLGMWLLVDTLGYPHHWVQLVMIFVVAVFLFANLRLWVFE